MRDEGIVAQYAVGRYTPSRPAPTILDVFVTLEAAGEDVLAPLSRVYEWARGQGFGLQAEHLLIAGVPVQLLPAYNALVEASLSTARQHDYAGVPVRVVDPEHLVALALQAGGARRRERAWQLLEAGTVDRERLREILTTHAIAAEIPDDA